jgi:hypothetical protein
LCAALTQAVDLGQETVDVGSAIALERRIGPVGKPLTRATAHSLRVVLLGAQDVCQHPDDEEDHQDDNWNATHFRPSSRESEVSS